MTAPLPVFDIVPPELWTVPRLLASAALAVMFPVVVIIVPLAPVTAPANVTLPVVALIVPVFATELLNVNVPPVVFNVLVFDTGPVAFKFPLRVIVPALSMAG